MADRQVLDERHGAAVRTVELAGGSGTISLFKTRSGTEFLNSVTPYAT